MIRVELHSHTNYSPDGLIRIAELNRWLTKKQINKIAITDHNTIDGAVKAFQFMPEKIIIGQEIDVTYEGNQVGELLAYFVTEAVPGGTDVFTAIEKLRTQGAFISIPHPKDSIRTRWTRKALGEIVPLVDGVEVFNSRCAKVAFNREALMLADEYEKIPMAGSDAHSLQEIGRSFIELGEFFDVDSFKQSLNYGKLICKRSPHWVHLLSRKAAIEYGLHMKLGDQRE